MLVMYPTTALSNESVFERWFSWNNYPEGYDKFGLKEKLRVVIPGYDICYEYRDREYNTGVACYMGNDEWKIIN